MVGELGKIAVQYGIPGGAVFKIGARGRAISKAKRIAAGKKLTKTQIAKRAGFMAGAFGATDFLASDPDTPTFVAEKESEEGLTGSDLALV